MDEKTPARLRAADADRERVATTIQAAGTDGRLTLEEVEQRLTDVYAARYLDELSGFTADLERPEPERPARRPISRAALRAHPALRVHLAVIVVIGVLLTVRWAVSGVGFFWPVAPMFWLALTFLAHARVRGFRPPRGPVVPY